LKKSSLIIAMIAMVIMAVFIGGCSGSSERAYGLEPEAVVKTAFEAAKSGKVLEAAAYVAPSALTDGDTSSVSKMLTGFSLKELKTANLLSVKKVSTRGNFAVAVATIHQENTLKIGVKTLGLEKIEGEWYIIPTDRIVQDAKYRLLAELLVGN
jgi:PBP1b-binding outer membrane lipoprotein LpoB